MSDLNSMSEIVRNEIKTFEQKIQEHVHHVNVLRECLEKLAPTKDLREVRVAKRTRTPMDQIEADARNVAAIIRQKNCNKKEAVRFAIDSGLIVREEKTLYNQLTPSFLGRELYRDVFKGTKYVK